jgi:hypothetical protein
VDAGPLAALVHCLAHAARKKKTDLYVSEESLLVSEPENPDLGGRDGETKNSSDHRFRAFLARDARRDDSISSRSDARACASRSGTQFSNDPISKKSNGDSPEKTVNSPNGSRPPEAPGGPVSPSLSSNTRETVRAVSAAALGVPTSVGSLSLEDLRAALLENSLLAGGLDECVDALIETEWEGGDDGYIAARGERASAMRRSLTVAQFRGRLAAHGLEGSLLELNLLTEALAAALGATARDLSLRRARARAPR